MVGVGAPRADVVNPAGAVNPDGRSEPSMVGAPRADVVKSSASPISTRPVGGFGPARRLPRPRRRVLVNVAHLHSPRR